VDYVSELDQYYRGLLGQPDAGAADLIAHQHRRYRSLSSPLER
jgi:hypothetical protein